MRGSSFRVVAGISALISASVLGAPTAQAASHAGAASKVTVQGRVLGPSGQPISGEGLYLVALPPHSVLSALEPGQQVPWRVLGSAVTTTSGAYSIGRLSMSAIRPMVDGGLVNLELLTVSGPQGFGVFGFPVRVISTAHGMLLANFSGKIAPAFPKTVDLRLRALPHQQVAASPHGHCVPRMYFKKNLGGHQVVVGGAWSILRGVNMSFTYLTGQSSNLQLGVSPTGSSGSWSGGGTAASDKSVEEDYPVFHNNVSHVYRTVFRYGKFYVIKATCDQFYQAEETKYLGGATEMTVKPIKATRCELYQGRAAGIVLNRNSAYTFSTGVDITSILGISLSSQTGYDTDTRVAFHVDHGSHRLCGTNTFPGSYPERAQWGERK